MDKYTATEQAYKHGYEKGYNNGYKDALAERWIPVSEMLPENGSDVLAFSYHDTESRIYPANYDHKIWMDCLFNIRILSVTHWMPIPAAPKEG